MSRIQTRAGESLADQYDTPGSVAGVEELLSRDVGLFHETPSLRALTFLRFTRRSRIHLPACSR